MLVNSISPQIYPVLIALLVIVIPVIILAIVVFVKQIIKFSKKQRAYDATEYSSYEELFGGNDNIQNIEVKMSRVIVTVNELDKIDLEALKTKNIGVLISGNVVKCSSAELAEIVSKKISKNK